MKPISSTSKKRFGDLASRLAAEAAGFDRTMKVALADRYRPTEIKSLDLGTGALIAADDLYDLIILDSEPARRLEADGFRTLAKLLQPAGMIAVRQRSTWLSVWRRFALRRQDDLNGTRFSRGMPRSKAALQSSGFHFANITTKGALGAEQWLVASRAPLFDTRFRDQIGRVATDYLRLIGPIAVAGHLPGG